LYIKKHIAFNQKTYAGKLKQRLSSFRNIISSDLITKTQNLTCRMEKRKDLEKIALDRLSYLFLKLSCLRFIRWGGGSRYFIERTNLLGNFVIHQFRSTKCFDPIGAGCFCLFQNQ